jgi:hypothetical protein
VMFVIITAGVPAYKNLQIKYKIKAQANALHSLIYVARNLSDQAKPRCHNMHEY